MISITGVPGSGKTYLSSMLRERGFQVSDLNEIARVHGCLVDDTVDIQCMKSVISSPNPQIAEAHYSHLLPCNAIIILVASEDVLRERLEKRGYSGVKIEENIDAILSDSIFYESLDRLPRNRIMIVNTTNGLSAEDMEKISEFIKRFTIG
ncbi:MAG: hypothetical protein AMDU2_EPLC00005G0449 [Thermoplasmatales archaeon E-plasma]|jgi:adenylate kinase|nr:MAG: hypothetical protein AMDU2_EPLC00005G0449 [Thermoplasmatales archaeon E-plasma]